ncbi:VIT1/CCC1 family predicted Fe2+/Mn2+ transporter [Pedobacter sp. AK013]|uniref:VIT1/CCC1 transporter family protein n=1 Tax=Pedobacter sp. AK013 TaxID=2723071 RepID=UPI00160836ED|nr:VIT family protein [Pedobacter sp. AK013]MBB6236242.1 VIT1/CCC1 family predicted Fe2+/Mn2+ transporter [Pedobacter sp. AK013]
MELEKHYTNRTGWLRAAVLGANDGIISTTSLVIGIAAASDTRSPIVLAALAGLVAGALSMAAGEYVSVSSQADIEKADLAREKIELETMPEVELKELTKIYVAQGLDEDLALQVAIKLTEMDALSTHARDELGINEYTQPKPLQAAFASGASFISGGILPFLVAFFAPIKSMVFYQYGFAIVFLALSGAIAAKAGGSSIIKGVLRICFWGTVAMAVTALAGYIFGAKTS